MASRKEGVFRVSGAIQQLLCVSRAISLSRRLNITEASAAISLTRSVNITAPLRARNSKARTCVGDRELAQCKLAPCLGVSQRSRKLWVKRKYNQSPADVRGDRKAGFNRMRIFYDELLSFGLNVRTFLSKTPLSPREYAGFKYLFFITPGCARLCSLPRG